MNYCGRAASSEFRRYPRHVDRKLGACCQGSREAGAAGTLPVAPCYPRGSRKLREFGVTSSRRRVPLNTDEHINRRIRCETAASIRYFVANPDQIDLRLRELDEEWDIERAIEANASTLAFAGVVLGATGDRRWLLLPALVTGFLLQHAVQGWCPPVPILRRLGFRTAHEIEEERTALKALRGDFKELNGDAEKALRAAAA